MEAEARITVHRQAGVTSVAGRPGQYRTTLAADGEEETVEHGALIVATGGGPAPTREYLYGQDPRVLTQRELEEQLADGTLAAVQTVVMVQCVGSREPERPYCSRVCCTQAVKNALKLKQVRPEVNVYVLYREVRTYGFREAYYQAAREAGVVFLRYEPPSRPRQAPSGGAGSRPEGAADGTGDGPAAGAGRRPAGVERGHDRRGGRALAEMLGVALERRLASSGKSTPR